MKFESNTLAEIIRRFSEEYVEKATERNPLCGFNIDGDVIEYREDESDYVDNFPETLVDALNFFISMFYRWGENPIEISKKENDNKKVDLSDYDSENTPLRFKIVKEIFEKRKDILEDSQTVEIVSGDYGWGGDDESRYYEDNYDEDTLKEIYKTIAAKNHCSLENVTYEDFCEYVGCEMSTEENSFRYIKETGEIQRNHSFELN